MSRILVTNCISVCSYPFMAAKHEFFINSVRLVQVADQSNIPTVLHYQGSGYTFGYDALSAADSPDDINENFKVDLGKEDIAIQNRRQYKTAGGELRSAHGLCNDFIKGAIAETDNWIQLRGLKKASRVLVAEPIAMGATEDVKETWLSNYRAHLRRILANHFEEVDFLPEPFAVFQYYRYGLRHPLLAQRRQHIALVIDFGGGTFDVSVIETTAEGDVKMGGKNSRPLSASSKPIGGFFINYAIADYLLLQALDKKVDKNKVRQAVKAFDSHRNEDPREFEKLNDELKHFVRQFKSLVTQVEHAKIAICRQIADWRLEAIFPQPPAAQITVPTNPFKSNSPSSLVRLTATDLREIFEKKIWGNGLKPAIAEAISRAQSSLEGKSVSVVLLSGGSANIGWLGKLLARDLANQLEDADILELQENFQEIVAKGLAVECARRTYTGGAGDFRSVTYNRLCLVVSSDNNEPEIVQFKPVTSGIPELAGEDRGVLLPSASGIGGFIEKPIRWKFRLKHPPKSKLDYYFLRSSFDTNATDGLFNLKHTVHTPKGSGFDSQIQVELTIRDDGTTLPRFIYRQDSPHSPGVNVSGEPFYLDMTFGTQSEVGEAYIGFDFGTSNSSFSYVEQSAVKIFEQRAQDKNWRDISDLSFSLPYPVAAPLSRFISETKITEMARLGLTCFEGFLATAAYVAYAEYRTQKGRDTTSLIKTLQRSAGPLWALLQQSLKKLGSRAVVSAELRKLLDPPYLDEINHAVDEIANFKHDKESSIDYLRLFWILGNTMSKVFESRQFGYFEHVQQKKLSRNFAGYFRIAHGPAPANFLKCLSYEGVHSFSDANAYLYDAPRKLLIPLDPLMFWWEDQEQGGVESRDLYLFDIENLEKYAFKRISQRKTFLVERTGDLAEFWEQLHGLRGKDDVLAQVDGVTLSDKLEIDK